MLRTVDDPCLLEWMISNFRLRDRIGHGFSCTFGPHRIKGCNYHVDYSAEDGAWQLLGFYHLSAEHFEERRATILQMADEQRGLMPRSEYVKLLILACITAGIVERSYILEVVYDAANRPAIREHIETGKEIVVTEFDDAYIAGVLARHRGKRPSKCLWWVDTDAVYHLHK